MRRSNPGATTCAAPATQTVVLRPLDCFASLAMTDRELAHLFLRVRSRRTNVSGARRLGSPVAVDHFGGATEMVPDAFASQINRLRHLLVDFADGAEPVETDARGSGLGDAQNNCASGQRRGRHASASRSNPGAASMRPLDCFVARAPRNDGWRSFTFPKSTFLIIGRLSLDCFALLAMTGASG